MASTTTTLKAAQSYADKVGTDYPGERYRWFFDMLQGRYPDRAVPPVQKPVSTIRIVDDMSVESQLRLFDAAIGMEVDDDFVRVWSKESPNAGMRLLVVHFTHICDLNFHMFRLRDLY